MATAIQGSERTTSSAGSGGRLLSGPIAGTIVALAVPTTVVMVVQILVSLAETYFIGFLGTDALAAATLVFPVLTFMQMVANGDIGGGIASATARALGAGRKQDANALVLHALVLGIGFGLAFWLALLLGGPSLYSALGGSGAMLDNALSYSGVVFAGAVLIWVVSLLAAALRGSGNVLVPAVVTVGAAIVVVPLSPALILGWGIFPRMGIAGAATAFIAYYLLATITLILYLRSAKSPLRLHWDLSQLQSRLFRDVLFIGGVSALRTTMTCLSILLVTGAVGQFGANAIAGYGIASRLDFLMIPLLFGLGTSVLTMVGANIGAGHTARAFRIAVLGTLIAGVLTELVGLFFTFAPATWVTLFSSDPEVVAQGSLYLQTVAPLYGLFGVGTLCFFVAQGITRLVWPFAAATVRLLVVVVAGSVVIGHRGSLAEVCMVVAASYFAFGAINAVTLLPRNWKKFVPAAAEDAAAPLRT